MCLQHMLPFCALNYILFAEGGIQPVIANGTEVHPKHQSTASLQLFSFRIFWQQHCARREIQTQVYVEAYLKFQILLPRRIAL